MPARTSSSITAIAVRPSVAALPTGIDSADILIVRAEGGVATHTGTAFPTDVDSVPVAFSLVLLREQEQFTLIYSLVGQGAVVYADTSALALERSVGAELIVAHAATWTSAAADLPVGPPAREDAALVFDAAFGGAVLVGGTAGNDLADAWLFNGSSWTQLPSLPSPRHGLAAASDGLGVFLFGGARSADPPDAASYFLSPGNVAWTVSLPAPFSFAPSPRTGAAMAYDVAHNGLVLFGGIGASGLPVDALWINGRFAGGAGPPAGPLRRWRHTLVYDAEGRRVILFGGMGPDGTELNDTWALENGTRWRQIVTQRSPSPRAGHAAAYDPERKSVVIVGGRRGTTLLSDAWELRGDEWAPIGAAAQPPAGTGAGLVAMGSTGAVIYMLGRGIPWQLH